MKIYFTEEETENEKNEKEKKKHKKKKDVSDDVMATYQKKIGWRY